MEPKNGCAFNFVFITTETSETYPGGAKNPRWTARNGHGCDGVWMRWCVSDESDDEGGRCCCRHRGGDVSA
jgi:hypothetical protein